MRSKRLGLGLLPGYEVYFDVEGSYCADAAGKSDKFSYRSTVVAIDAAGSQVVAPPQHEAEPVVAKAAEPKVATEYEDVAKPAAEAVAPTEPPKKTWVKWALYGGLAFANLLIIGLGYVAYRVVMGGGKSKVLDESDDDDAAGDTTSKKADDKAKPKTDAKEPPKRVKKPVLDLPDDAIDIDSGSDKKKD